MKQKNVRLFSAFMCFATAIFGQNAAVDSSKMVFCNGKNLADCQDAYISVDEFLVVWQFNPRLVYASGCTANRLPPFDVNHYNFPINYHAYLKKEELVDSEDQSVVHNETELLNVMARFGYEYFKETRKTVTTGFQSKGYHKTYIFRRK